MLHLTMGFSSKEASRSVTASVLHLMGWVPPLGPYGLSQASAGINFTSDLQQLQCKATGNMHMCCARQRSRGSGIHLGPPQSTGTVLAGFTTPDGLHWRFLDTTRHRDVWYIHKNTWNPTLVRFI